MTKTDKARAAAAPVSVWSRRRTAEDDPMPDVVDGPAALFTCKHRHIYNDSSATVKNLWHGLLKRKKEEGYRSLFIERVIYAHGRASVVDLTVHFRIKSNGWRRRRKVKLQANRLDVLKLPATYILR
jgi:hypothetical protein